MRLRNRVGSKYAASAPRTAILVVISSNLPLTGRFPVALADNFSYYSEKVIEDGLGKLAEVMGR